MSKLPTKTRQTRPVFLLSSWLLTIFLSIVATTECFAQRNYARENEWYPDFASGPEGDWTDPNSWFADRYPGEEEDRVEVAIFRRDTFRPIVESQTNIRNESISWDGGIVVQADGDSAWSFDVTQVFQGQGAANSKITTSWLDVNATHSNLIGLGGTARARFDLLELNFNSSPQFSDASIIVESTTGGDATVELTASRVDAMGGFYVKGANAQLIMDGGSYTAPSGTSRIVEGGTFVTKGSARPRLHLSEISIGADSRWLAQSSITHSGTLDGTGTINLVNPGTALTLDGDGPYPDVVSNSITGNGGLKVMAGTRILEGSNSFTGGLYIEDGATVEVSRPANTGGLANTIHFNGGQLSINDTFANFAYYTDKWSVQSDSNLEVASSAEIYGQFQGSGSLDKIGKGKLFLRGDNTGYAGTINVQAGQLLVGMNDSLGEATRVVVQSGASFTLEGVEAWGSLSGSGAIDLGRYSAELFESGTSTIGGFVLGTDESLIAMSGTGKIHFDTFANLNNFKGNMSVHSGSIELDGFSIQKFNQQMSTSGEGVAEFNTRSTNLEYSGFLDNRGRILKTGTGVLTLSQLPNGNSDGVVEVRQGTLRASLVPGDTLQLTGGKFESTGSFSVDRIDTATIGGTLDTGTGNATVRQSLTGAGNLLKQGSGNLDLTFNGSDHSGFAGELTIQEGLLRLKTSLVNGRVHLESLGSLESTSNNEVSLGGLSGSGTVNLGEGSNQRSILVGGLNQDSTFSGTLLGPGSLIKAGSGTFSFTGTNANSLIEVRQGTLGIGEHGLGQGVHLANGTTLRLLDSITNPGIITGQGTIDLGSANTTMTLNGTGNHSISHKLVGLGGLRVTHGNHTLNGLNSFTGGLHLDGGIVRVAQGGNTGGLANAIHFNGGQLHISNSGEFHTSLWRVHSDSSLSVASGATAKVFGTLDGSGHLSKSGAGRLELGGNFFPFGGSLSVEEGSLAFSGSASRLQADLMIGSGADAIFSSDGRFSYLGNITGEGSLLKDGSGELVFQGDSSGLSGDFLVSNGSLSGSGKFGNLDIGAATFSPGESPAIIEIENFNLRSAGLLDIELGGLLAGLEYDQLLISGDATIAGMLNVSLIDGFTLGENQEFLIADIGGSLMGEFQGLSEGSLVGAFDNQDLFITYRAGSGNSIGLFTAVPEPSGFGLCLVLGIIASTRRRRA